MSCWIYEFNVGRNSFNYATPRIDQDVVSSSWEIEFETLTVIKVENNNNNGGWWKDSDHILSGWTRLARWWANFSSDRKVWKMAASHVATHCLFHMDSRGISSIEHGFLQVIHPACQSNGFFTILCDVAESELADPNSSNGRNRQITTHRLDQLAERYLT